MTHRLLLTASLLLGCDAGAESLDRARVTATDAPFAASPAISWPNNLPPLSVDRMQVGYIYVANPALIDELPRALVRDDDVYVLALPDYPRTFRGQYRGFRVIVANTTDRPVKLLARESSKQQLAIVHEALDQNGNWAPIEYLRFTTCGNSWYTESLAGGSYMDFIAPHYAGDIATQLRIRVELDGVDRPEAYVYSKPFFGRIHAGQLVSPSDAGQVVRSSDGSRRFIAK